MECISIIDAKYVDGYKILLTFNTKERAVVDLQDIIEKYSIAEPLRDKNIFAKFYLDSWPTLVWPCGFDIAPESLYKRAMDNQ